MGGSPVRTYIALGSNLGDRSAHLETGFEGLQAMERSTLVARSSIIETAPVGPPGQGAFLNAVACVETELPPRALLEELLEIEQAAGRDRARGVRWGPRTLDLDLLLYGEQCIEEPGLVVPHPRMHERLFVLEPLCELAPDLPHPVLRTTLGKLLEELRQQH